ncbi:hypothetical protein BU25DRAFT_255008 [Macroventuria anomochaeta]|uniref:Uncharacterized protein n=1 Tax=Macroventuria anomochaeta TaxID=301207 RepID=A0ACB6S7K9_9PLEO|nr:uncharacterized protein BU25DRAFT_255008 [Macroventuria anomochaeta]KAF2630255.1 hypothetical protein BU25DRAFT_255008 [Macroventuria anomochaeta]
MSPTRRKAAYTNGPRTPRSPHIASRAPCPDDRPSISHSLTWTCNSLHRRCCGSSVLRLGWSHKGRRGSSSSIGAFSSSVSKTVVHFPAAALLGATRVQY